MDLLRDILPLSRIRGIPRSQQALHIRSEAAPPQEIPFGIIRGEASDDMIIIRVANLYKSGRAAAAAIILAIVAIITVAARILIVATGASFILLGVEVCALSGPFCESHQSIFLRLSIVILTSSPLLTANIYAEPGSVVTVGTLRMSCVTAGVCGVQ